MLEPVRGSPDSAFRDRSRRLVASGIAVIGAGALVSALGLAHLLLPLAARLIPSARPGLDPPAILMGALLYLCLGAVLVWIGIGSVRLRRWVRPLMLSLAWIWLITGAMAAPLAAVVLDDLMSWVALETQAPPPDLLAAVKIVLLAIIVVAGVVVPAFLIWAYRHPDVGRTCEARHPEPAWTDGCPLPVLGLSVGLALAALVVLPTVLRPVVPLFGFLVTGLPGSLLVFGSVMVVAYLATSIYRLRPGGWWATTAALIATGASTAVTFAAVDPLETFRAMGYPEEVLASWSGSPVAGRPFIIGSTVVLTLLSIVYMARVRKHFTRPG